MPIGILFWVLMVLWFVGLLWVSWPLSVAVAPSLLLLVLLGLLGWKVFGPVVQ